MKRPLTPIEKQALGILAKSRGPMSCCNLGAELWGRARGNSSNPFSRPAGRVLHRLLRMGLVKRTWADNGHPAWTTNK